MPAAISARRPWCAPADGYTLLLVAVANAINATLYDKLNFDFVQDIAPVAGLVRLPIAAVVHPVLSRPESFPELVAYAKANPSKVNMASPGNGTSGHVAGELFKMMTGIDMVHVPYRPVAAQAVTRFDGRSSTGDVSPRRLAPQWNIFGMANCVHWQ